MNKLVLLMLLYFNTNNMMFLLKSYLKGKSANIGGFFMKKIKNYNMNYLSILVNTSPVSSK